MAEQTDISWTDSTFNPWIGCTKVGPGCDNCYAEAMMDSRLGRARWGAGQPRVRTSAANWRKPLQWNVTPFMQCEPCGWRGEARRNRPLHAGERGTLTYSVTCPSCRRVTPLARRRVFCSSVADVFDNEVPEMWRVDLFRLIAATPSLDWLLLTKRISNAWKLMQRVAELCGGGDQPMPNVWLGATMVNRAEFLRDLDRLRQVPAAIRFVSAEPLLGDIGDVDLRGIDWLIAGGESGPHARPMEADWVRNVRDLCARDGVAFHFKQWGGARPKDGGCLLDGLEAKAWPRAA